MRLVRTFALTIGGIFAVLVALVAGALLVVSIWPELIAGSPPPIAAGLRFDSSNFAGVDKAFDNRIHRQFPTGTPEQSLRQTLMAQGFRFEPKIAPGLVYHWGMFPCSSILVVTWTGDKEHRIVAVSGNYEYRCV
jgi:hypothetical protein